MNRNYKVVNIEMVPKMRPRLLIDPFSTDYEEKRKVAHYFLLAASVIGTRVVGRSENARKLIIHLHNAFGDDLFEVIPSKEIQGGGLTDTSFARIFLFQQTEGYFGRSLEAFVTSKLK